MFKLLKTLFVIVTLPLWFFVAFFATIFKRSGL